MRDVGAGQASAAQFDDAQLMSYALECRPQTRMGSMRWPKSWSATDAHPRRIDRQPAKNKLSFDQVRRSRAPIRPRTPT